MIRRPGVSLPELLLVAWLFAFVLAAVAAIAGSQSRLAARASDRSRAQALVRTTRLVLGSELRALTGADITAMARDSVRIRAVRGGGPVCAAAGTGIVVRYRGVRRPDPMKDSVILARATGTSGIVAPLHAVATDDLCEDGLRLDVGDDVGPGGWALIFETGTYHFADRAVRYRRGAGGRQPLTEAVLRDLELDPDSRSPRLRLGFEVDSLPRLPAGEVGLTLFRANDTVP